MINNFNLVLNNSLCPSRSLLAYGRIMSVINGKQKELVKAKHLWLLAIYFVIEVVY